MASPNFKFDKDELMKDCSVVELKEGSMMYFPAGMYHCVECTEDSISINISLVSTSWGEFISKGKSFKFD